MWLKVQEGVGMFKPLVFEQGLRLVRGRGRRRKKDKSQSSGLLPFRWESPLLLLF